MGYWFLPSLIQPKPDDYSAFEETITELFLKDSLEKVQEEILIDYPVNINEAPKEVLLALGFNDYQSNAIIGFREKIGPFESLDDLNKVYGMNDSTYQQVIDKIVIPIDSTVLEDKEKNKTKKLFQFNPNEVSKKELQALGFEKMQIRNILKYRDKGGIFYEPKDLLKIYSIDQKDYDKWEKFIVLPQEEKNNEYKSFKESEKSKAIIEINLANAEDFEQISGIGQKFSERIVKYREQLGGYYNVEQLKEVYHLPPELIDENKELLVVNEPVLKTININQVDLKTFIKHPYVSYNMALRIINYREVHGMFKSVDEIKTNDLVKEEDYSKLVYYLSVK